MTINDLRNKVGNLDYDKTGMIKIKEPMDGVGFFPAFRGVNDGTADISRKDFIVLGQDQDNLKGYEKNKANKHEENSATWRNMDKLFGRVKISMDDCFFTNAIMGLRDTKKSTGKSPGYRKPEFTQACLEILEDTIKLVKPKAIICLGIWPARFLGMASGDIAKKLICLDSYQEIDAHNCALIKGARIDRFTDFKTNVAIIVHPSYRGVNAKKRSFKRIKNHERAEVEILKELISTTSGMNNF